MSARPRRSPRAGSPNRWWYTESGFPTPTAPASTTRSRPRWARSSRRRGRCHHDADSAEGNASSRHDADSAEGSASSHHDADSAEGSASSVIFAKELNSALRDALTDDPRVVMLGEDIADPYGGAVKVVRGLSTH